MSVPQYFTRIIVKSTLLKVVSQGTSVLPRTHLEVKTIDRQLAKMFFFVIKHVIKFIRKQRFQQLC